MKTPRRGSMFLEVCVAMLLVGSTLALIAQLLTTSTRQQHSLLREKQAMLLAGNALEQIMARPWDDLTQEKLRTWQPTIDRDALPQCEVRVEVTDHADSASREIHVVVQWLRGSGPTVRRLQLTGWRFAAETPKS